MRGNYRAGALIEHEYVNNRNEPSERRLIYQSGANEHSSGTVEMLSNMNVQWCLSTREFNRRNR